MILLDANLLVYAHASESPHHEAARAWFERIMNAPDRVAFPWPTLLAFVRLMGNANVMRKPVPLRDAWARAEGWLALPQTWIPVPTDRHREILSALLEGESRPDVANDAHLAALAVEHGLTVCSTDRDFSRFPGIRWENPLAPRGGSTFTNDVPLKEVVAAVARARKMDTSQAGKRVRDHIRANFEHYENGTCGKPKWAALAAKQNRDGTDYPPMPPSVAEAILSQMGVVRSR